MNYTKASDIELWKCCQQDDMRAYSELFDRYAPKLHMQVKRYVKDEMDAEELVMDLLHKMWRNRGHLNPIDIGAYLKHAIRNQAINYLHKNIPIVESLDQLVEDQLIDYQQADHSIISDDLESIYQDKLNQLSPQRLKVYKLSREENLSHSEIAKRLNLSVSTVENHISAVLSFLRESMKEHVTVTIALIFLLLY